MGVSRGSGPGLFAIGILLLGLAAPAASAESTMGIQPDGRIVLLAKPSKGQTSIVRLNPDGSPDMTFGSAGSVEELRVPRLFSLAIQPDGKIVAGALGWTLTRYLPDGAPDPGFMGGGFSPVDPSVGAGTMPFIGQPESILFRPDGRIVVGGNRAARNYGPSATAQILAADGSSAETVGSIPVFVGAPPEPWSADLEDLVQLGDGSLAMAGSIAGPDQKGSLLLARFVPGSGTNFDDAFGGGERVGRAGRLPRGEP